MFRNRFIRWSFFLLIGVAIGMAFNFVMEKSEMDGGIIALSPDDNNVATIIKRPSRSINENADKPDLGGAFTLVDQDGKTVTQDDYTDQYKLIFFGFTYCPAICPTELLKVTALMNHLGDDMADKITPIFITVDPERDTPEQIKTYLESFHPRMVGLTGSQEQIDAVKKEYKVYASKVENEMMDEYMMDHSAFLYFMAPNDSFVSMYPSTDTAAQISEDIQSLGAL